MRSRTMRAAGFAALGIALAATAAAAFTSDARRLAMAGAQVPGGRDLATANVAYQTMPARRSGRGLVIPVPLGLLQLAADFPTFDAQDPDFSATRLANLALNPPFFMELSQPSALDGDISIAIARNAFAIQFEDAQRLLPQQPVDVGSLYARPLFGLGLLGARTFLAPVVLLEGSMAFDDAMYGVLARGEPLLPNSTYRFDAGGETMAGTAFNLGWSDGGWGRENGDGLYAGAYTKYILGFAFGKATTAFTLASGDTIFGDGNPLDVGYEGVTRWAPGGRVGHGIGFDTGVAYRMGSLDFGLGFRDLGSQVHWSGTEVERSYLDPETDEMRTETVASGEPYTLHLPMTTTLNAAWSGARTVLAADLTTNRWSTEVHLGAERRLASVFAVRGGLLTDSDARVQYAWGVGVGLGGVWLDLGFQTHNRTLTGERGLTFGTSLALR